MTTGEAKASGARVGPGVRPHRRAWLRVMPPFAVLASLWLGSGPAEAPIRLITEAGVEVQVRAEIFQLFAALNGAGYVRESRRGPPPLEAPQFHPLRRTVRKELETVEAQEMEILRGYFEDHPESVRVYIGSALGPPGAKASSTGPAGRLDLSTIRRFAERHGLSHWLDRSAEAHRSVAAGWARGLEADLSKAQKWLRDPSFRAPKHVLLVANALDSHDAVYDWDTDEGHIVVVGPGFRSGRDRPLVSLLKPYVRAAVKSAWGDASRYRSAWNRLRSARAPVLYRTGEDYLTAALTWALVHRIRASASEEADQRFLEEHVDLEWARSALRIWDASSTSSRWRDTLGPMLARIGP